MHLSTSEHKLLQLAGIPHDIQSSVPSRSEKTVQHKMAEEQQDAVEVQACVGVIESKMDEITAALQQVTVSELKAGVYSMALDTGATHMLCWDDQDRFLKDRHPANAVILGAQQGSKFAATSRGSLAMACFTKKRLESGGDVCKAVEWLSQKQAAVALGAANLV